MARLGESLRSIGAVLQSANDPLAVQKLQERRRLESQGLGSQQEQLQRIGQIQAGTLAPRLAPGVQGPAQPTLTPQQQAQELAQIGTPESLQALQGVLPQAPTPITPFQQQQLAQSARRLELQEAEEGRKVTREGRLQQQFEQDQRFFESVLNPTAASGTVSSIQDQQTAKPSISALKDKNKGLMGMLTNPRTKDLAKAQITSNNEEIKFLRQIDKELRDESKKLSPEQAAKTSMVKVAVRDVQNLRKLLIDKDGEFNKLLAAQMMDIGVPFIDTLQFAGVFEGRKARQLALNAINAQLRAESGAAVPEEEVERAMQRFVPSPLDSKELALQKLQSLEDLLTGTLKLAKGPSSGAPTVIKFDAQGNIISGN